MADYNSNYTGAEVDAAIAKTQALESALDINNAIAPTSATAGDVWTADGDGGAAWVTPSGGGGKYVHNIYIKISTLLYVTFILIDDHSAAYSESNYNDFRTSFVNVYGTKHVPASGYNVTEQKYVWSVFINTNNQLSAIYGNLSGYVIDNQSTRTLEDVVISI